MLTAAPGVPVREGTEIIATGVANVPAIFAICCVTALLVLGIQESANANNIVVVIKLSVVVAFIGVGAFFVDTANWTPFIPEEIPPPPPGTERGLWSDIERALIGVVSGDNTSRYGISGIITAAATIFFAYLGFEAVSTAGAEARNPSRDMPIGILGSLLICTLLYILTSAVLVGIVPYAQLDTAAPIAVAVNAMGIPWFAILVKIGAIAGISSVMLVLLYGQTRIFYTMSRDGLLPPAFSVVHKKFRTPWIDTLIVGFVASCRSCAIRPPILDQLVYLASDRVPLR
jgi:APA family basic amino acid/polyamine antiporter